LPLIQNLLTAALNIEYPSRNVEVKSFDRFFVLGHSLFLVRCSAVFKTVKKNAIDLKLIGDNLK